MSSTELDAPPSSDQIRSREFATIRRGGYDPDQVDEYLQQIAARVDVLERALHEARLQAASQGQVVTLPDQGPADDPYERLAARFAEVLRTSDEQAERILQDARDEAALTLAKAGPEAARIRKEAQSYAESAMRQADEILQNAKAEAERALSNLSARRGTLVEQLQEMQSRLVGFALELESAIVNPSDDDEPGAASPEAGARESDLLDTVSEVPVAKEPPATEQVATELVAAKPENEGPTTEAAAEDGPIDPRFEDLRGSRQIARDPGDLTPGKEDASED